MFRRLFVSVLVAALTLAVAPHPASGLGDDHFRCMYRCKQRGDSYAQPRRSSPVRPLRHDCSCGWGQGGWGRGGHGPWSGAGWHGGQNRAEGYGDGWYHRPGRWDRRDRGDRGDRWDRRARWDRRDRWDRRGWGGHRWRWDHRDRGEHRHDPSRDSGYDAHRHHPRGRDF